MFLRIFERVERGGRFSAVTGLNKYFKRSRSGFLHCRRCFRTADFISNLFSNFSSSFACSSDTSCFTNFVVQLSRFCPNFYKTNAGNPRQGVEYYVTYETANTFEYGVCVVRNVYVTRGVPVSNVCTFFNNVRPIRFILFFIRKETSERCCNKTSNRGKFFTKTYFATSCFFRS